MNEKTLLRMITASIVIFSMSMALYPSTVFAQSDDLLRASSYTLVSKKRVGRTTYEYEYDVRIENNTADDLAGIIVKIGASASTILVKTTRLDIPMVAAFASATASPKLLVQVDRRARFNPKRDLQTRFDSAMPQGLDLNRDDVRDDVAQSIAEYFSTDDRLKSVGMDLARIKQINTYLKPTDSELTDNFARGNIAAICLVLEGVNFTEFAAALQDVQFDTPERIDAYRQYNARLGSLGPYSLPSDEEIAGTCDSRY